MATDTAPAALPGPPDPSAGKPTTQAGTDQTTKGFLAAMVAPVQPARSTLDLPPIAGAPTHSDAADGVLDRSAPGKSSASFHDTDQAASKDPTGARRKAQGSIWKAWWLAGAQRWAKGGGTANKRLDLKKARAQANQVKEARTVTVNKSAGVLPIRNSGGSGAGYKGNSGKSDAASGSKGTMNSSGNRSGGTDRGGTGGGGRGSGGGSRGNSPSGGRRDSAGHGKGTGAKGPGTGGSGKNPASTSGSSTSGSKDPAGAKNQGSHDAKTPKPSKDTHAKEPRKTPGSTNAGAGTSKKSGSGGTGKPGGTRKSGAQGKEGNPGTASSAGSSGSKPHHSDHKPAKADKHLKAKNHKTPTDTRTPLEKSREIGHKDGSAVRQVVDHVKAYKDGAVDGYHDQRTKNAREHDRLNKAHDKHKPKPHDATHAQPVIVAEQEDDGVTTDVKPLTVQNIDANTLTLGADATRTTYGRRELRNFKQYERKLEAKETVLQKIADACKQLEKEAEQEAKDCQDLLEQAKSVEGGEKLIGKLTQLADQAKNQTAEAAELAKRAKRSAEMCKVVLTNIQTRYAPLYKAVVDSDETKPAELRFYNDKGTYAPAA
jgi:hypothetical protein